MLSLLIRRWPISLTGASIAVAVAAYFVLPDMNSRSQLGGFMSGFASAIAFIWLIAAYQQQGKELQLQRQELSLQRNSLDLQRDELRKMGKYAAMDQVASILEQFEISLRNVKDSPVRSATELSSAYQEGLALWNVLLDSNDDHAKFEAYMKWMKILGPCEEFLARLVTASNLYSEANESTPLPKGNSPVARIYRGQQLLWEIPYVRHYAGTAYTFRFCGCLRYQFVFIGGRYSHRTALANTCKQAYLLE